MAGATWPGIEDIKRGCDSRVDAGTRVALAAPAALSLVTVLFPAGRDRARALAVWGEPGALGAVAGLLLSGLLTDLVSWRWV